MHLPEISGTDAELRSHMMTPGHPHIWPLSQRVESNLPRDVATTQRRAALSMLRPNLLLHRVVHLHKESSALIFCHAVVSRRISVRSETGFPEPEQVLGSIARLTAISR